jgi:hypothetical protein
LTRPGEAGEFPSDKYVDVVERLTTGLVAQLADEIARPIVSEIVVSMNEHPRLAPDPDEFDELFGAFQHPAFRKAFLGGAPFLFSRKAVAKIQKFARSFFSLPAIGEQLRSASDAEFLTAQNYLKAVGSFIARAMIATRSEQFTRQSVLQLRAFVAPALAPPIFRLILRLVQTGNEHRLRKTVELMSAIEASMTVSNFQPVDGGDNRELIDELVNIWNDLDMDLLYDGT